MSVDQPAGSAAAVFAYSTIPTLPEAPVYPLPPLGLPMIRLVPVNAKVSATIDTFEETLLPEKDNGEFLEYRTPVRMEVEPPEIVFVKDEVMDRSWKKRTLVSDPVMGAVSVKVVPPVMLIGANVWLESPVL
jgi:hypothetical protein